MRFPLITLTILLSIPQLANAQGEWVEVPSKHQWNLLNLASSSSGHIVCFVLDSGSYKAAFSYDEGQTWEVSLPVLSPGAITQMRWVNEAHFFSAGRGIASFNYVFDQFEQGLDFYSLFGITHDSGRTWRGIKNSKTWDMEGWPGALQFGVDDLVMLPFVSGVYASAEGVEWQRQLFKGTPGPEFECTITMTDRERVFAVSSDLFNSDDSGRSFTRRKAFLLGTDSSLQFSSVSRLTSGTLIAADNDNVYRNLAGADQWSNVASSRGPLRFRHRFDQTFGVVREHLYYTMEDRYDSVLLESTDDGRTWTSLKFDGDVRSVVPVTPTLTYLLAGNKIYKRERPANVSAPLAEASPLVLNNPVSDQLILRAAAENITIADITGRNILRAMATDRVDVSMLPSGVYQLVVTSREAMKSQMFVIER